MGVDVSSYTYIGVYTEDAEQYLIEKGLLKEGELEEVYYGDIGAMHDQGFPLQVQSVSYYSDEGSYVGFDVCPSDYKNFDRLLAEFNGLTGDEGDVHTFTQWH